MGHSEEGIYLHGFNEKTGVWEGGVGLNLGVGGRKTLQLLYAIYLPMKMEQTECSETSAYKLQAQGNYPKESIQHTEHGESFKSRLTAVIEEI